MVYKCRRVLGFSLVELMITVSVIAVLTGLSISIIKPAKFQGKARDGVRKNDIAVVKGAVELYYSENNVYPDTGVIPFGSGWSPYLRSVPSDPKRVSDTAYAQYCYTRVGGGYLLCAKMEDINSAGTRGTCNSVLYDYCVQNPF